jgi:hypothetical protein
VKMGTKHKKVVDELIDAIMIRLDDCARNYDYEQATRGGKSDTNAADGAKCDRPLDDEIPF